jgi:hypothetical protein
VLPQLPAKCQKHTCPPCFCSAWIHAARFDDRHGRGTFQEFNERLGSGDSAEKAKAWNSSERQKAVNDARMKTTDSLSFIVEGMAN